MIKFGCTFVTDNVGDIIETFPKGFNLPTPPELFKTED